MKINRRSALRATLVIAVMLIITISSRLRADSGNCGGATTTLPFTDVPSSNVFFCSIAEAYFSALTNGTTPATYSPAANLPREQMAALITRTMDQSLKRGSRRAALKQFWTTGGAESLALTSVGGFAVQVESDGVDLWVANNNLSGTVSRVRASDGRLLETWTATLPFGVLVAMGKIFVTGETLPGSGSLYLIDPAQPAGPATTLTNSLGNHAVGITFDGHHIWTANSGPPGSVSIVTLNPFSVNTVTTGFGSLIAAIFDGANIWVTDQGDATLKKLDSSGNILMSLPVGSFPRFPAFDGTNIWVPNQGSDSVSVVRATGGLGGTLLATLTGNGLSGPTVAAFDGERILVTNSIGNSVSLWRASDLTPIGTFFTGADSHPGGACSDGLNFWITISIAGKLARF
jgi:hypothetical protein